MPRRPEPVRDLAWSPDRARELGEDTVELWVELLARLPELPVSRDFKAEELHAELALEVPEEPLPRGELLRHLRALMFEGSMYPGHPGFLAYISGSGTVPGAAADLLAAALNQNSGGFRLSPGATTIEQHLMRWLAGRFGLPPTAGGHVVAGGAVANLVGLKIARDRARDGARERGIRDGPPLAFYASTESHVIHHRAADLLGLGSQAVRPIPVDDRWQMRPEALAAAIERDLHAGVVPAAVIATAGTTATGAIDALPEIAELSARHGTHLHVDACYGGAAVLADELRPLLAGIEWADSIAVDAHKWLYTPLLGGCVLVRDARHPAASFATEATYIWLDDELRQGVDVAMHGPDFSRGFAAFKIWLSLLAHGRAAYARRIAHDAALARYLGELVEEHRDFELMAPPSLSICCFRYAPGALRRDDEALDRLNERIMTAVMADGRVYCSNAVVDGRFCLRACIVNIRTEAEHLELLLEVAAEHGARLAAAAA
ncbi:MAG: aspartate aminotransferase family protein [Thermoleophilaceae bacterium]|nr:aspartate aminotransferase family protein [Thermoleophilaceae bacterium]